MFRTTNKRPRNLAASMGRWSATHWKTATFGWLALVAAAFAIGGMVGTKNIDENTAGPGQSGRMDRILAAGFELPASETVLIQNRNLRAGSRAFDAAVRDVVARVSKVPAVEHVRSPLDPANAGQIAKNKHAAVVEFDIRGAKDKAKDKIGTVVDTVADAQQAHPGFFIGEFGDASAQKETGDVFASDLGRAGVFSVPLTLIILVFAFGALVAAGIPLLLGLTAVFATFGLVAIPSHFLPLSQDAAAVVLLIGLAVGVDYSMFYLKRYRQERGAGRSERAALAAAAATSGRSVLVSGLTVMVAMAGLFLTGDETFVSFGYATMIVVAMAMVGSLTVLPALLSKLGDRVDRGRVPLIGRLRRKDGEGRVWGAIVERVLRRPVLSAALSAGLLVALALPALQLRLQNQSPDSFPSSMAIVKTYKQMEQAFPGTALPADVVVRAPNMNAPAMREAIDRLERQALQSGRMHQPITIDVNKAATVARITIPIDGNGVDATSGTALRLLRHEIVPKTVGAVPSTEAGVTGLTAEWKDSRDQFKSALPVVVAFVLVFAFCLMLLSFRSIVVAIKAIVLNLLSVAAAYGVLVLAFQDGVAKGLLGFTSTAGVDPVVPMLLFVILFGLSMDYHVFIVSRIRELFQRGASMDEAISDGIKSTAGVVTSAAIVMVGVFSIFMTLSILMFKQFGVGLAAAILIDATIVRGVLLPASMKLLGAWNWYLPRWLEWLPRMETTTYEPEPVEEPEPARRQTARRKRALTPARIFGLVLIAVLALGLAYLALAPKSNAVSVPADAKAGDLVMHPCHYDTEKGSYAADCGTLVVRENRSDPQSRLIALPVKRIRARSAHPAEPIFRLQGGPGISNMSFSKASRFADKHDVVLVGYRGVDGSARLDCPEVESALKHQTDFLGQKSLTAYADGFRSCAARLRNDGVDVTRYGLVQQVDDLEAARTAFGYRRIDLLSESAGTRTALIYSWRYPRSINRSVMIGANPPGHYIWDAKTFDEQIARYAALCSRDAGCRKRTDDLAASIRTTSTHMPDRFWFLPIDKGNVRAGSLFGLFETTSDAAPLSSAMTLDTWLSADEDDSSGLWFMSLAAELFFPTAFVWGQEAAVGSIDAPAARAYFAGPRDRTSFADAATTFLWGGGRLADAWPSAAEVGKYQRVRTSRTETLLVGGALDFAIPPQIATRDLLPHLPNGHQVVLSGIGHSGSFWTQQPDAGTHLVNTFFDSGRVDGSFYKRVKVDFAPDVTQATLGKGIAAAMIGLAALAVLSLLFMWYRVHHRGRLGRRTSIVLRSIYPLVLGLGGWFAGVIVLLVAFPTVPLDDRLVAVLSIGAPVGLGIYLAWTRSDRPARTRAMGFAGAMLAAFVGAMLGFHAGEDLTAVVTTIVGAALGANLALLLLDVVQDSAAPEPAETAQPVLTAARV